MRDRPGFARAHWFGLVAAILAIAGTGIALASTDRHAMPPIASIGYSKQ